MTAVTERQPPAGSQRLIAIRLPLVFFVAAAAVPSFANPYILEIGILLPVDDEAVALGEHAADCGDDPHAIRAGQRQDPAWCRHAGMRCAAHSLLPAGSRR